MTADTDRDRETAERIATEYFGAGARDYYQDLIADFTAALAAAREEERERAARVLDQAAEATEDMWRQTLSATAREFAQAYRSRAAAIRALKDKSDGN